MDDNIDNNSLMMKIQSTLCTLYDVQLKQSPLLKIIKNDKASDYFLHGLCRRLQIIIGNLEFFFNTIPPTRENPLNASEVSVATIHLNSLYVHLYGAVDNIAWTFAYEMNLYPNIVIEQTKLKREINLFHKDFLKKIEKLSPLFKEYTEYLITRKKWYEDMSERRAPSTHRMPLYVIPAVLNKTESQKYIYHQEKHLEEACELNFDEADKHFNQLHDLGKFVPLFGHDPKAQPISIYPVINIDCDNFVQIINKAFAVILSLK